MLKAQSLKSFWLLFIFFCCSSCILHAFERWEGKFIFIFSISFQLFLFSLNFKDLTFIFHSIFSRTQNSTIWFIAMVGSIFSMFVGRRNAASKTAVRTWKCFWMFDKRILESSNESGENWVILHYVLFSASKLYVGHVTKYNNTRTARMSNSNPPKNKLNLCSKTLQVPKVDYRIRVEISFVTKKNFSLFSVDIDTLLTFSGQSACQLLNYDS